jgi:hypothetical protein
MISLLIHNDVPAMLDYKERFSADARGACIVIQGAKLVTKMRQM